ncbi:bifunctional pyridoxamine 5'-phosphate oxidase family protein/GNAT family N-acetyltransferase [Catellatospora sp. TT07R-123]|uniref:bifunctional pyridoxamine 5'-phosphate oxidase family protein/GNAT family N-acetyltransferase n=1 Tax=Catellatospora sp. TT07R-123 TaxID=2733863 RepID=UPI001BB3DD10
MRERMSYDREAAHAILDEGWHCSLAFVRDGLPQVLPTLHVRLGDTLYLHGSSGGRMGLEARGGGLPVAVTVTHLDGLVLARSQFNHSANYRSVIAHGTAVLVTDDEEKRRVLTALTEKIAAGRAAQSRGPNDRELAQTAVLALPLTEVSVRSRADTAHDDDEDLDLPHWAGVVPLRTVAGLPDPAPGVLVPVPDHLRPAASPWLTATPLRGRHVHLEPLDLAHTDGLFTALGGDEQVWEHLPTPCPHTREQMADVVRGILADHEAGRRVPYVQRDAVTGEVFGTTSLYPEEKVQALEIGGTILARSRWRTAVNTEAKLLLLTHAFEVLGARRVTWQTDVRNLRSQAAIERLGAVREATLRANRNRKDGSARDSALYSMLAIEWPDAQKQLTSRLLGGADVR